jgi:hypothetical protein
MTRSTTELQQHTAQLLHKGRGGRQMEKWGYARENIKCGGGVGVRFPLYKVYEH